MAEDGDDVVRVGWLGGDREGARRLGADLDDMVQARIDLNPLELSSQPDVTLMSPDQIGAETNVGLPEDTSTASVVGVHDSRSASQAHVEPPEIGPSLTTPEVEARSKWVCSICTMENCSSIANCEVCGTSRAHNVGNSESSDLQAILLRSMEVGVQRNARDGDAKTECSNCTFLNAASRNFCEICQSPLVHAPPQTDT